MNESNPNAMRAKAAKEEFMADLRANKNGAYDRLLAMSVLGPAGILLDPIFAADCLALFAFSVMEQRKEIEEMEEQT